MVPRSRRGWDVINRKADAKLGFVAEKLVRSAGEAQSAFCSQELLSRSMRLACFPEIGELTVRYLPTSKLFAILYDFTLSFEVDGGPDYGCAVELCATARRLEVKGASACRSDLSRFEVLTNNPLIEERLRLLDVTKLHAAYDMPEGKWQVECSMMVGSATWNLLPPVLQLIEPTSEEYLRMIELARLMAVGLRSLA